MIAVPSTSIIAKAHIMPRSYLEDCRKAARLRTADGMWCFAAVDYYRIRQKYLTEKLDDTGQKLMARVTRGDVTEEAKATPL